MGGWEGGKVQWWVSSGKLGELWGAVSELNRVFVETLTNTPKLVTSEVKMKVFMRYK